MISAWLKNPLFRKELRIGLRERKFVWMQVIYLALACSVTLYSLRDLDSHTDFWSMRMEASQLVVVLILLQSAVLLLITPALSSGAISSERERNCLDLLLVGGATPAQIVAGKLMHGWMLAFLLLLGGLPLGVLSLVLGGGTFQGLWLVCFVLIWCTLLLVQFGLMLSARERRSAYATTQTYACLAIGVPASLWLIGTVEWIQSLLEALLARPWHGYGFLVFNLLCLSAFFFLKTLNHLEARARYPRLMGRLFVVWYALDVAAASYYLREPDDFAPEWLRVWSWLAVLSLALLGCFLNQPHYRTRRDEREFSRSLGSRWWAWTTLFSLGMLGLNVGPLLSGAPAAPLIALSGLAIAVLWASAAITRALGRLLPRAPFRLVYFFWLAVAFSVPAVALLLSLERPIWSLIALSPLFGLLSVTGSIPEIPAGELMPLASWTLFIYLALVMLIGGVALLRPRDVSQGIPSSHPG